MWAKLKRDPVVRLALATVALLPLFYALPWLLEDPFFVEELLLPPLFHGLVLLALLYRRNRTVQHEERRFWNLIAGGQALWLAVSLFYLLAPGVQESVWAWLSVDSAYLLFYLLLALAIEIEPHAPHGWSRANLRFRFRSAGTLLFLFGLAAYFVLIPNSLNREVYGTWVPSAILFVVLDLYLLMRLMALCRSAASQHWRTVFGLFAGAVALWTLSDTIEALYLAGAVGESFGAILGPVWDLPTYLMIFAARHQGLEPSRDRAQHVEPRRTEAPLVVFALLFPALHYALYAVGIVDEASRTARDLLVLSELVALGGLALLYQALLEGQNRLLQGKLLQANSELQRVGRMESIGRLAGGVAHDFNNLLTVIRGSAECLLGAGATADPQVKHVKTIVDATAQGSTLTRQLLAMGSKQMLQPRVVELNEVVFDSERLLRSVFPSGVRYTTRLSPEIERIWADPVQIGQVLLNLAVNARDAMPEGGTFSVGSRNEQVSAEQATHRPNLRPGGYTVLTVSDTGEGMDERTLERIFDPFFSTKQSRGGTGLGLATSYGIVRQSGGDIRVQSRLSHGTTFEIYLPHCEEAPQPAADDLTPAAAVSEQATVLLVDDESGIRELLEELLSADGYAVLTAENGQEAMDRVQSHVGTIDLILTDVVMPVMDGAELAQQAVGLRPQMPILFMSGYVENPDPRLQQAYEAGALIQKPFSTQFILEKVGEALAR